MTEMRVFLFGNQALVNRAQIQQQLVESRGNPFLGLLLQRCSDALRHEISQLSPLERKSIPAFNTIDELNDRASNSDAHEGVQNALLCISQLARYVGGIRGRDSMGLESCVVGLSTGLLAAAVVALSPTIPALMPLAVEAVLIAFRLGLHVKTAASNIEMSPVHDDDSSWSYIVPGKTKPEAQDALDDFHQNKTIPQSHRAYVAAFSADSVTISGPPTTLKQLFQTSSALTSNHAAIPVYGPYHAPHLHKGVDIDQILHSKDSKTSDLLSAYSLALPLMSTSSGVCFDRNLDAPTLFTAVIRDILTETLSIQRIVDGCTKLATETDCGECNIISFGPSNSKSMFAKAMESEKDFKVTLHEDLAAKLSEAPSAFGDAPRTSKRPKLAIVGMAGRFPNAADHEKFWDLLEAGLDVHKRIPKDRFNVDTHYDPTGKIRNTSHTPFGCFIDEPGLFDPRFFNMSPREATQTDPMHRLGLASAYEALEMAGYVPNRSPSTRLERIGTFYGQTSDDWREINEAQDIDTYFITAGVRAFAPGRINYYFKFSGPSFSVDTACSSSAAAMQLACTSLWAGDCDTAVAGGLNVMTNSDIFAGLSRGQFLSKTGNCQTFDNDADGYCRGDGIGTVILKRLDDALADNDRILGVILETATNHSANAISITHPHAPTQEVLFKKVMDDAGKDPHDVNYVEMHGTGTQAGDGTEMRSVTNVFAPASRTGQRKKPLHLGSVKANVGHGEAVSGVTAMIKCLLMLQKNQIPPHCGIKKTINQSFPQDLNARNVHIAFKPTPLASSDGSARLIFVNNFSAAGGNTAMLLEDAPARPALKDDGRGDHVITVSAKSKSALRANTKNLVHFIKHNPYTRLPDLSYTTTARRIQHNYRIAFACDSLSKASEILASKLDDAVEPVSSVSPTIAFAYTGQGSHYTALGKQLYDISKHFRSDIESFDNITQNLGFPSFLSLLSGDIDAQDLSPLIVQVGLSCIQMALTRLWASWGVKPDVVIGHSLGEYAALNAAGVLSVSETIYLVGERAKLLQEKCTANSHAMLATKSATSLLKESFADYPGVEVACVNGARETVLGGTVNDIDQVAEKLSNQGTKCTKLNTQFAFHSSQVDPILVDFENKAKSVTFNKPQIPVISPLLSSVLSESHSIDEHYLSRHARETVNFVGGMAAAQQLGLINDQTVWVELGPHPVCMSFVKQELGHDVLTAPSLRKGTAPYKTLSDSLAMLHTNGISIDWNEYHRDFIECVQMLDLPTYAFDNKNYWIQYTGDWNLHKGQVLGLAALPAIEAAPKLSTTTVHKVISEVVEQDKATVVIESDISRPDLLAAISGHVVNGTALCPSSIYGDMAMTVAEHLYKLVRPDTETVHMNVCHMEVFKPFIANDGGKGQTLRLSATTPDITTGRANLVFASGTGKSETQHAKCFVDYGSGTAWLAEWQRNAYLVKGRIESLKKDASSGKAHRMLRGMAYKLFGAFVDYDSKYRGMEEVILDSPELEATAHIAFQTKESDGNFVCSPYWIDSLCHLAGFIVNANDAVDSSKQVYVSHGWESMRFAEPIKADKTYRSYVKMQPLPGNMIAGDVYIFDGDRIIGMCGSLKFQCIPRTLLNTFLPPRGLAVQKAPVAAKPAPKSIAAKPDKKSAPTKVQMPKKAGPSVTTHVLNIIASEVGIPVDELADGIDFANMGVDSLMSLSISGRIREELEIDAPSSLFVDYPTVGALKGHLLQFGPSQSIEAEPEYSSGSTTPSLDSDDMSSQGSAATPLSPPDSPGTPSDSDSLSMIIRQTISEEMGVDIAELSAADDLSALGMDSLMSLSILGMLREKAGLSLPADFLVDNQTIKAIETALHIGPPPPKPQARSRRPTPEQEAPVMQLAKQVKAPTMRTPKAKKPSLPDRFASSVLLQGSPKTAEKSFWLVPDGGGAPTSYVFLGEISPKLAVWGLTSPYCKTPEEYMCGVVGIATKFIQEIKRRQPKGPYHIGGWSAGGVISFETVRQLVDMGDVVETLVFIDTPCPLIIEPLPGTLHRFFGSIGLLGEGDGAIDRLPPWLLPHFAASVHALSTYDAAPIPMEKCPKVMAIWCEDGVCKEESDPRPDPYPYGHAQWLLENRTDFGTNLWEEFLDEKKIMCRQMAGNHFSMMKAPYVDRLTEFLREALA
ncbi:hypothetical protein HO133_003224 [Letharia lupina]|uniref:Polyketide synthase n=1 Tax=Letharia lupina TaxID=560253 RepID=A0A8H6CAS4_9LECA|nr:uncharacterized protein HO133_003224 [Letharia lupina]KAF6220093.1 hypothetical protein HO133_003224 [Letharia lupina]